MSKLKHESPWLHFLNRTRPVKKLDTDYNTNVLIVGGGIAGISTAYFLLRHTSIPKITLVDAGLVAHGASGHNGGIMVTGFEKSFVDLVSEFGLEMASEGQREMNTAWDLLEEISTHTQIKIPVEKFTGHIAIKTKDQVLDQLETNLLKLSARLPIMNMLIAEDSPWLKEIPAQYQALYKVVSAKQICEILEITSCEYSAVQPMPVGLGNSALICELVSDWMLKFYKDRFEIFEQTKINDIVLNQNNSLCYTDDHHEITTEKVILCTNGFEDFTVVNNMGPELDHKLHYLVRGIIGYMAGYLEPDAHTNKPAAETNYLPNAATHPMHDLFSEQPYFYVSRRPVFHNNEDYNLICLGGPEQLLPDASHYSHDLPYPDTAVEQFSSFMKETKLVPKTRDDYKFLWHGLMGFTPNGVRLVGPEPYNPILLYNLGCNGIGLLPSIVGGRKIARILAGEKLAPSIFDPRR